MPQIITVQQAQLSGTVTVTGTTETAAISSPELPRPTPGSRFLISGYVVLTVGTGQTTVTLRLRRGTGTAGTVVSNVVAVTSVAGNVTYFGVDAVDAPGDVDQQIYTLTVTQAGGAGNGTVQDAGISVMSA